MFWNFKKDLLNNLALIDTNIGKEVSYDKLNHDCENLISHLGKTRKQLIFLLSENSYTSVLSYIASLRSNNSVLLLDSKLDSDLLDSLIIKYSPDIILSSDERIFENYNQTITSKNIYINRISSNKNNDAIYPELAVLLSTSGTTGSSKLVKLSYKNLQSNAESITEYLDITDEERPITSLPMSYSYGLSVINSHLLKGATIILTNQSFVLRNFWNTFNENKCTSFAGVPYSYQLLHRTNFKKLALPTLKTLTQAGGNLSENFKKYFEEYSKKKNVKFFVMYGQTEATARISYVPAEMLEEKIGSIGIPIPGGKLELHEGGKIIENINKVGELIYHGNNVMLGYATKRASLEIGDELNGILYTGDLGKKDEDGYFYVTGRAKRFIKIFGLRLNLDDTERMIENFINYPTACVGIDDLLNVFIQTDEESIETKVRKRIKQLYKLHDSVVRIHKIHTIPVTSSGKRDYKTLTELIK